MSNNCGFISAKDDEGGGDE